MSPRIDLSDLWSTTFQATYVITTPGRERHVERLLGSLPFDPRLVTLDRCESGIDCRRDAPEANHHVVVGERHRRLVAKAAARRLRNVFVFEDDAEFVPASDGRDGAGDALRQALEWARAHPDGWDVFYLGFLAPWFTGCAYVNRAVVRPSRPLFAHALAYNGSVFERLLAVDFRADHRPPRHRWLESLGRSRAPDLPYFSDGVGSIDTWLSYARLRRHAAHPVAVIQHALPPGTAESWTRRTGRRYDPYRTPRHQVSAALVWHYVTRAAAVTAALAILVWMAG
jgi:hypothetical protein